MLDNIASRATFLLVAAQFGLTHAAEYSVNQEKSTATYFNGPYVSLALNPVYLSFGQLQMYDVTTGTPVIPATRIFEKSQLGFGASVGYSLVASNIPARFEAEYIYLPKIHANFNPVYNIATLPASADQAQMTSTISSSTVMVNGLYDFINDSRYLPYFTGGLGFSHTSTKSTVNNKFNTINPSLLPVNYSQGNTGIAWNVGAGVRVKATKHVFVDVLYRFMRLGEVDWGTLAYPHNPDGFNAFSLQANQVYGSMLSFKATWQD